jgi:hypothetical protein
MYMEYGSWSHTWSWYVCTVICFLYEYLDKMLLLLIHSKIAGQHVGNLRIHPLNFHKRKIHILNFTVHERCLFKEKIPSDIILFGREFSCQEIFM